MLPPRTERESAARANCSSPSPGTTPSASLARSKSGATNGGDNYEKALPIIKLLGESGSR